MQFKKYIYVSLIYAVRRHFWRLHENFQDLGKRYVQDTYCYNKAKGARGNNEKGSNTSFGRVRCTASEPHTHTQTQRSLLSFNSLAIQISATFPAVFKWFLWDFSSQTSYSLFLSLSHHPHPSVAGVTGLGGPLLSADLWLPITQRGRLKREKIRHGIKNYGSVPTRTPLSSATRSSSQGWQLRLKPCECSRLHWEGGEWLNIFPHTVRPRGETHHQTIRNMFSGCGQTISHSLLQLSNINSCAFKQIDFPTH